MNRVELNTQLIVEAKRSGRAKRLSVDDRVALNLLWRNGVEVPILAKIYRISRNTIYYKALTGTADSYPTSDKANSAVETNALVDRFLADLGGDLKKAVDRYVPQNIIVAVNNANEAKAKRKK